MAIAWKRSVRQLISGVIAAAVAYGTWQYTTTARIFEPFPGLAGLGPLIAAVGAFFVGFYVAMMLLKSKAAR